MERYQVLTQERADLINEGQALFASSEGRALSDEEKMRDDEIQVRLSALSDEIGRIERQRDRERQAAENAWKVEPQPKSGEPARLWSSFGEQLRAIAQVGMGNPGDPRLYQAVAFGAGEGIDSDGGFLVQPDFTVEIDRLMNETGSLLRLVDSTPVSGNGLVLKAIDETSRVAGSRWGGIRGYWVDEGVAPAQSAPKFRKIDLKLVKAAVLGYATDELLGDAAAMSSIFEAGFAEELIFMLEDSIINGTGGSQPLGLLNGGSIVSVAKETNQGANTILTTNLSKMWSRLHVRGRANAVWLINQDAEPQLDELTIPSGTAAVEPRFVTYGADGILRIKGRPVIAIEYCPTLGTLGDIILADMSQYKLITKAGVAGGVQQASSMHVRFTTDEMAFRATYRVDGQPKWNSPLTPFKGTNTVSPFVALATRA